MLLKNCRYGLIVPNKGKNSQETLKRHAIFDEDSDDDEPKQSIPTGLKSTLKRQVRF